MTECIVRMEMPKNCGFCPMAHWNKVNELTGCDAVGGKRYIPKDDKFWNTDRPTWCPIIGELPEGHGDLIDRDEYLKLLESYIESKRGVCENKEFIAALQAIIKQIKCVKAVIAAEMSERGTTAD